MVEITEIFNWPRGLDAAASDSPLHPRSSSRKKDSPKRQTSTMPPLNLRALGRIAGAARRRELVQLAPPRTQARQHHPSVRQRREDNKPTFTCNFWFFSGRVHVPRS